MSVFNTASKIKLLATVSFLLFHCTNNEMPYFFTGKPDKSVFAAVLTPSYITEKASRNAKGQSSEHVADNRYNAEDVAGHGSLAGGHHVRAVLGYAA